MTCTCAFGGLCALHPKCPWCRNYITVFESSNKVYSCTRCKKTFTRKTVVVNPPSTKMASKDKNIMAKTSKTVTAKKSSKKIARATRESNLHYEFVKMPKDAPNEDTTYGCILAGIRKAKRGSLDEVTESATRCGLTKATSQDPQVETRKHLRYLANAGAVRITRNGVESNGNGVKKGKKGKKSFKLVKK